MNKHKPFVYIASPYIIGDPCINARFQLKVFTRMVDDGKVIPFAPLASHFIHSCFPRPYEGWIEYDNYLIKSGKVDAMIRLNSIYIDRDFKYFEDRSAGADNEVYLALKNGIPVFDSETNSIDRTLKKLYHWIDSSWYKDEEDKPKTITGSIKNFISKILSEIDEDLP